MNATSGNHDVTKNGALEIAEDYNQFLLKVVPKNIFGHRYALFGATCSEVWVQACHRYYSNRSALCQ